MTTPTAPPVFLLTAPYVTVPEFRAAPTWLDSDDLIPGGTSDKQDDELYNVLLRASAWADNRINPGYGLGASTVTDQQRVRPDRRGMVAIHPAKLPVRQVTAISYGPDPSSMTAMSDLSGVWIEDGRSITASVPARGNWGGFLEFGPPVLAGEEMFVSVTYAAGFAAAVLTGSPAAGATSVTVSNPAGIYPGDVLRIWDPGAEEAVTVAAGYVPGSTSIPLAAPTTQPHTAGAGVSAVPADIRQAVICYTVALLLREDVSSEQPFAGAPFGPAARRSSSGGKSGGLVNEAECLLLPYRRIR